VLPARIRIIGASGLRKADWFGKSDPYCTVEIDGALKLKTATVPKDLDPEWNYEGVIEDYVPGMAIVFKVWDDDSGLKAKSDDFLGTATLTYDMIKPDVVELPLENAGAHIHATLRVQVIVQTTT